MQTAGRKYNTPHPILLPLHNVGEQRNESSNIQVIHHHFNIRPFSTNESTTRLSYREGEYSPTSTFPHPQKVGLFYLLNTRQVVNQF